MIKQRASGYDLPLAFLGALAVHSVLGFTSLSWTDVFYGVDPGPTSLQMELVTDTRQAEVVAESVSEGDLLSEPEPLAETLPGPEPLELTEFPPDERPPTAIPLSSQPIPIARVPRRAREVATSPAPSPQTADGNSDLDQAATDLGAEAAPDYLLNPEPRYPEAARRRGVEGLVLLEVLVLADGTAGSVRVARSSGSVLLDDAALEAVRVWRFRPASRVGVPADSTVTIPIRFRLETR